MCRTRGKLNRPGIHEGFPVAVGLGLGLHVRRSCGYIKLDPLGDGVALHHLGGGGEILLPRVDATQQIRLVDLDAVFFDIRQGAHHFDMIGAGNMRHDRGQIQRHLH